VPALGVRATVWREYPESGKRRSVIDVVSQHTRHRPELVEGRLKGARGDRVVRQAHHGVDDSTFNDRLHNRAIKHRFIVKHGLVGSPAIALSP